MQSNVVVILLLLLILLTEIKIIIKNKLYLSEFLMIILIRDSGIVIIISWNYY
jgi:hypothetical protein